MKSVSLASPRHLAGTVKPSWLDGLAEKQVMSRLEKLQQGRLQLAFADRVYCFGQDLNARQADGEMLSTRIEVLDPRFFSEIAFGGSIGAGEAYIQGYWRCDDLVSLVRMLLQNRDVLEEMESGYASLTSPLQKLFHWVNRNTHEGARRNIAAHYDLGNDFFRLWLDESMMYSCAMFDEQHKDLHAAQVNRLDRICQKLQLSSSDHVLEIGTGWGGFAIHAAKNYGCRVTTTTISKEQYEWAKQAIADAGLHDRITLLQDDFRDLNGSYDKLVSIEMIEAIGSDLYPDFFRICSELLKQDGLMLVQAITIADQNYAASQRSVDFIQRYIFPGACLPSGEVMNRTVAEQTNMRLLDLEDIGLHYATTLRRWRENFFAVISQVRSLGYPESFIRMWEFYLCYCEGAFLERAISDVHLVWSKPGYLALPTR
jgi:cyclopropane-fatty-acyl-phospholipid synthase